MIDVKTLQATLELRWLANGFTKLAEPIEAEDYPYIALEIPDDLSDDDFDFLYWEPALIALEVEMIRVEGKSFYRTGVFYKDGLLVIASTKGEQLNDYSSK